MHNPDAWITKSSCRPTPASHCIPATVEIRDITGAHVHIKTLNGPVTLTNVQDGHVEVDSLSGEVTLNGVTGPLVQVISTSGGINYIGDFGDRGEYRLTSHSGNIEAMVPESTSADVSARSVRGEVHDDIPLQRRKCLLGYYGSSGSLIDRGTAQLQW
jgi:DUF4097 and DUF4098 domain-containing protein YvlB